MINFFRKKRKKEVVPIRKPKEGWYNPDYVKPQAGQRVRIDCSDIGERDAIYLAPMTMLTWSLTDCTHPAANMNMFDGYVMGWKPADKNAVVTIDAEYKEVAPLLITG